jgi:hypothetical protein
MPWVAADGVDNYDALTKTVCRAQVYGEARPELVAWCADQKLPLQTFAWAAPYARAGLSRNALYLLRPDTYIGLADESGSVEALHSYLRKGPISH